MTPPPSRRTPLRHRKHNARSQAVRLAHEAPARPDIPRPTASARVLDVVRSGAAPAFGQCDVFYKDAHILLVDKGPGLLTVPPDSGDPPTVMGWLARRLKGAHGQVFAVHRLDRDTSGVLVVARTRRALDTLVRDLTARLFHRVYLAIVLGTPPPAGTLRGHLSTVGKDLRMRTVADGQGQLAVTHFRVVEQALGHALVAFKLETGRRNQIRAQMAELGHPLLGEKQYGDGTHALLGRQALHSHRLHLTHPVTGARVEALSPLPDDMLRAWHALGGRHGPVLRNAWEIPGPGAPTISLKGLGETEEEPRVRGRAEARNSPDRRPANRARSSRGGGNRSREREATGRSVEPSRGAPGTGGERRVSPGGATGNRDGARAGGGKKRGAPRGPTEKRGPPRRR